MVFLKALLLGLCIFPTARTEDPFTPKINILKEILDLKASVALLQEEVKTLQEDQPKIAFTAVLAAPQVYRHLGPFPQDTIVVYANVKTNIGKGYNSTTGVFTAPVRGIYVFAFNCFAVASNPMSSVLFKNDEQIVSIWDEHSEADNVDNGFNAATLVLEPEDKVYIKLWMDTHISKHSSLSTFSGFLLSPLKKEE